MIGRARETERLYALVDKLGTSGGALHLSGAIGIGKTLLLTQATERAARQGASTIYCTAPEPESTLPFSGAAQLLAPLRDHLRTLPGSQQRALAPCLGLAPPMSGNPLVEYTAAQALVAAASRETDLLLVVDDVHWLDQQSANLVSYVGRRLSRSHAAIIVAGRPWPRGKQEWGFPTLKLAPLTHAECGELASVRGAQLTDLELKRLYDWSGGNPQAIVDSLPHGPRVRIGPALDKLTLSPAPAAAWEQLLRLLPTETQRALFIVVADESCGGTHVAAALERTGASPDALVPMENVGLTRTDRHGVELLQPLLGHLSDDKTDPQTRAAVHGILAELSEGHERAWHLAAAASHPDDAVAEQLAAAAARARVEEGFAASSRSWQRAAELSRDPNRRAQLLVAAATDAIVSGDGPRALLCCETAVSQHAAQLDVRRLEGLAHAGSGHPHDAVDCLLAAAEENLVTDPVKAADLLAHAAAPAAATGRFTVSRRCGERVAALAPDTRSGPFTLSALSAHALTMAGQVDRAGALDVAITRLEEANPLTDQLAVARLAQALLWAGRPDEAHHVASAAVELATTSKAATCVALALVVRSEVRWWTGHWGSARTDATRAVEMTEHGDRGVLGEGLCLLARVAATAGDEETCEAAVDRLHREVEPTGALACGIHATASQGLLALGAGDVARAVDALGAAFETANSAGLGNPMVIPVAGDLGEALSRTGDNRSAALIASWLENRGQASGLPYVTAAALRLRALLAADVDAALDRLAHARGVLSDPPLRFELARTLLCEGQVLRRAHRIAEARTPLRRALDGFRGLGATSWAEQAAHELAATGLRPSHSRRSPSQQPTPLSPQELQVARAVTRGLTNSQVAGALFMSRKTVEAHLTRIYRKLGVHSRTDLTRVVLQGGLDRDVVG